MSFRSVRLIAICAAVLTWSTACDFIVQRENSPVTIGSKATFTGSSAKSPETFRARPGVIVNSDATLIVNDATVIGGSAITDATDPDVFAMPGINGLENNVIRVILGDIRGGSVQYAAQARIGRQNGMGGFGITALDSAIEVQNGTVTGGSVIGVPDGQGLFIFGAGFNVPTGTLRLDGPVRVTGTLASGTRLDTVITPSRTGGQSVPPGSVPYAGTVVIAAPGTPGCRGVDL
jgi:hypothetical protein